MIPRRQKSAWQKQVWGEGKKYQQDCARLTKIWKPSRKMVRVCVICCHRFRRAGLVNAIDNRRKRCSKFCLRPTAKRLRSRATNPKLKRGIIIREQASSSRRSRPAWHNSLGICRKVPRPRIPRDVLPQISYGTIHLVPFQYDQVFSGVTCLGHDTSWVLQNE